jgi:hypothetical protein
MPVELLLRILEQCLKDNYLNASGTNIRIAYPAILDLMCLVDKCIEDKQQALFFTRELSHVDSHNRENPTE